MPRPSAPKFLIPFVLAIFFWHVPEALCFPKAELPSSYISIGAYHRASARLDALLAEKKLELGSPLFIRIFKESNELEVWLFGPNGHYERLKTYSVCNHSGELGPKLTAGDKQSPEGFYRVGPDQMNPWSRYHLSFNLGYPNEYDQAHERTGAALMVHGRCSSIGCFAMTDYYMDEIYTLADAALARGQEQFQVHIFPFRLTAEKVAAHRKSRWFGFWLNLKEGFDLFERNRLPPRIEVVDGNYVFPGEDARSLAQHRPGS